MPEERAEPARQGRLAGLTAFRHRNYRFFWTGQIVSLVGTWMQSVAQSWLVLQLTNSAFQVGLIAALQFTPVLLLSMIGGVVADRRNKRRLLLLTQSASAVQALVLGLLVVTGKVQVYQVMALAACLGVINAFDGPVRQAFVVEMVGREDLMNAIALNSSAFNTARILGPAIGGVLIARFGVGPVYLINAASYLAVIYSLAVLRESELHAHPRGPREGVLESLKAGMRYVRGAPTVQVAIFLVGAVATFGMNYTVLLSVMARDVFKIGSQGFGLLMASIGVGSVLAALTLAFRSRVDPLRTMLLGGMGIAVFEMLFAGSPWAHFLPLPVFLLLLVGFSAISLTATANTTIQQQVPDELRGRVMSVYLSVFSGSVPLGGLFAGSLARRWGAPLAVAVGAGLSGVAVLAAWLFLRRKQKAPGGAVGGETGRVPG
jgi:MFS family permease